jgi:N-acetylmuramoyl-L-alanine amidase
MQRIFISTIACCCLLAWTAAPAAADAESDFLRAQAGYNKLQDQPQRQRYRDQWLAVIQRFDGVVKRYPDHPRAADACFLAADARRGLYKVSRTRDDARRALAAYDEAAKRYPDSHLADDALLAAGELLESPLREPTPAYQRYARLAERYPAGDKAPSARDGLARLSVHAPHKAVPATPLDDSVKAGTPTELTEIRFWSNPGYTRVVLSLSGKSAFTRKLLKADPKSGLGPRLCIDLENVVAAPKAAETQTVGDGLLRQIRAGRQEGGQVRVVLDLQSFKKYEIFPLADPYRIVIDIAGEAIAKKTAAAEKSPSPVARLPVGAKSPTPDHIGELVANAPAEPSLTVALPAAAKVAGLNKIVIDPGHGGKDPGAIGPSGVYEKDIVLAMAKLLGKRIEDEVGCEVIYTRKDDTFIPLEERTAIANEAGADLFISLHVNANNNDEIRGVETYYLNFSKNEQAAAVAARENGTSLKQVGDLEQILFDLMAHSKINESSRLAGEIQKALVDDLSRNYDQVKDLGVRQGPFYVLLGATMPSVLVESAFISNKLEESRLVDRRFQAHAVDAILRGVRNYATALKLTAKR